jgi:hypothetical protein
VFGAYLAEDEVVLEGEEGVREVVSEVVAEELLEEEGVQLGEGVDATGLPAQRAWMALRP